MSETVESTPNARDLRFAIVASRFNEEITARLIEGAVDGFHGQGVADKDIRIVRVPGAFEIPLIARKLAVSKAYHAIVCLGALIRGETPHFEYLAAEVARGSGSVALETGVPVIFGVLTTDTVEQAEERSGGKEGNRGRDAALAGIEMATLLDRLGT